MAEVLVQFADMVTGPDGTPYRAQACGGEMPGGTWQGWIEFTPPEGAPVRSGRETTQPNRQDTVYWATGLTPVYLEGALIRALEPRTTTPPDRPTASHYDEPAPRAVVEHPPANGILNPFSVYRKGEIILRRQLAALSPWHLVNIIRSHALSSRSPEALARLTAQELIELIVAAVQAESRTPSAGRL